MECGGLRTGTPMLGRRRPPQLSSQAHVPLLPPCSHMLTPPRHPTDSPETVLPALGVSVVLAGQPASYPSRACVLTHAPLPEAAREGRGREPDVCASAPPRTPLFCAQTPSPQASEPSRGALATAPLPTSRTVTCSPTGTRERAPARPREDRRGRMGSLAFTTSRASSRPGRS